MICQWNKKKIKRNHFVSTDGRQYKKKIEKYCKTELFFLKNNFDKQKPFRWHLWYERGKRIYFMNLTCKVLLT